MQGPPRAQTPRSRFFVKTKQAQSFEKVKNYKKLQCFIDFVEMKTKKGPNLKEMKNRETIEQQKFENLTGSSFGLNPEEFPG